MGIDSLKGHAKQQELTVERDGRSSGNRVAGHEFVITVYALRPIFSLRILTVAKIVSY
jgi:hypothetical protein